MADPRQVWIGNVPPELLESHVAVQLAAYGILPVTFVYRSRPDGEGFVVATFASVALAQHAIGVQAVWSNGRFMLLRCGVRYMVSNMYMWTCVGTVSLNVC
jgi:hypothetical protein